MHRGYPADARLCRLGQSSISALTSAYGRRVSSWYLAVSPVSSGPAASRAQSRAQIWFLACRFPLVGCARPRTDRDDTGDTLIPYRDEAAPTTISMVGQMLAGAGLTVTDPFDKKLNGAVEIAVTDLIDGDLRHRGIRQFRDPVCQAYSGASTMWIGTAVESKHGSAGTC